MDADKQGTVTFDEFFNWCLAHIYSKVQEYKVKNGLVDQKDSNLWGGGCQWQYDKTAFKTWLLNAMNSPRSKDRKELYGYLSECFLDADGDRDGLIGAEEFDFLIEKAATMPRRFGLAPSWAECYGDVAQRTQARSAMFSQMDKLQRGKIGLEEWIEFSMAHIAEKVRSINWTTLDFGHLERSGPSAFVKFLEEALADKHSEQYKSLYMHLFKTFVESDVDEKGAVTFEQFDILIEDAAQAPRVLGLAPMSQQAYPTDEARLQARRAEFDQMDADKQGTVTFDEFFNWCLTHIYSKVQEYRANGGR